MPGIRSTATASPHDHPEGARSGRATLMDPIERRVRETLAASGVPFELIDCDPSLADTAEFCAAYGYSLEQSANTIVVASKRPRGINAACVVLAPTRLDVNRRVREVLGVKKLSFASPEVTADLTGMAMGGVTPIALPDGRTLIVAIEVRTVNPESEDRTIAIAAEDRTVKPESEDRTIIALAESRIVEASNE